MSHYETTLSKTALRGFRSIDVTPDWRALFIETMTHGTVVITFRLLGTHKQLYGV
jgi:mRNA-degrading endonuclease YafQ of YafQ-DinJ toxin-antitoxin module